MVGGFVEHQKVGAREEQRRQHESAALTAGQAAYLPVEVVLPKQEQPEDAHELLFRHPRIREPPDFAEHRARTVQKLRLVLTVVAHLDQRAHDLRPALALQTAREDFEQRRLAAAVVPHKGDALAPVDRERQRRPETHAVREGKREIGHGQDGLVGLGRFGPLEAELLALGFRAEAFQLLLKLLRHLLT